MGTLSEEAVVLETSSVVREVVSATPANVVVQSSFGVGVVAEEEPTRRQHTSKATRESRTWFMVCSEVRNGKNHIWLILKMLWINHDNQVLVEVIYFMRSIQIVPELYYDYNLCQR